MREYKKRELLEIVDMLQKVNDTTRQNLKNTTQDELIALLTQSQQLAITLGNIVEARGEQNKQIIPVLEAFCETVYQIANTFSDEVVCRKWLKKAQKQIFFIKNQIQNDFVEDKKEILFLPYKASMWDSLESVWKAAVADERCDTYVMPIPYYDKNADGSLGKLHYEGDEYPSYVPITPLKDYNIAEHRPDVIYIHNPYDDANLVTSVHPMFYAKKLKEYTNMLVYIPYFVAIQDVVEKHFCVLPGTIYADRVIVQSEKVRQIYIEQFQKFERQNECEGKFGKAGEKFWALGSPKYDKVATAKVEDFTIPDQWKRLIWNEDGSRKKVVLYNTSIECMLNSPEKMIAKIRGTLNAFSEMQEAVLLWRPHPLLKATLQAMHSELLAQYIDLEQECKEEKKVIFDESADLYRAIVLSDVYYGDGSSVAELYQKTGKNIFIQSVEHNRFEEDICPFYFFIGLEIYENSLYGIQFDRNMIVRMDLDNGKIHYWGKIPNRSIWNMRMYHAIKVYEDKMYFIPFEDDQLAIYDFGRKEWNYIHLNLDERYKVNGRGKFCNVCFLEDEVYLLPFGYRAIVCLNKNDPSNLQYIDLRAEFPKEKEELLFWDYEYLDSEHIIIPSLSSNKLLLLGLRDHKIKVLKVGKENYRFSAIKKYNDCYWLIVKNALCIIKWDYIDGKIEEFCDFPQGCVASEKTCFDNKTILYEKYLYCFPARSNMAVRMDLESGKIEKLDEFDPYCQSDRIRSDASIFDGFTRKGDAVYLHYQDNAILSYNLETRSICRYERRINCEEEYIMKEVYCEQMVSLREDAMKKDMRSNAHNLCGERVMKSILND